MINVCAKSEVSVSTMYEDMKGDAKCRKQGGLAGLAKGHSKSLA